MDNIRLGIPQLTGLFEPTQYVAPPNADANNLSTIKALSDPSGTLERMQSDQVLKAVANLKLDGIDAKHKQLALDAIEKFKQSNMDMYRGNKGFKRLTLDGKQQLESDGNYRNLLIDLNQLNEVKKDYLKTMEEANTDFKNKTITPEMYKAFQTKLEEQYDKATSISDIPLPHAVYNNFLMNAPQVNKGGQGIYKTPELWADARNKPQLGRTAAQYDPNVMKDQLLLEMSSGEWQQNTRPMLIANGIIRNGMTPTEEFEAAMQYGRLRFNDREKPQGSASIYNDYGVSHPKMVPFVTNGDTDDPNISGAKVWDFKDVPISYTKGPVRGSVISVIKGNDGNWYGEFTAPNMINVSQDSMFSIGAKQVKDQYNNMVWVVPLDASDYGAVKRKGIDLEGGKEEGFDDLKNQRTRSQKSKPEVAPEKKPTTKDKVYFYNGNAYSFDELDGKGIDVTAAIKAGKITMKSK